MRARPCDPLAVWCEARLDGCAGRATDRHHRQPRSGGGTDDKVNTVDLCSSCHRRIHAEPRWSYREGWLVPSWDDPALSDPRDRALFGLGADWGDR